MAAHSYRRIVSPGVGIVCIVGALLISASPARAHNVVEDRIPGADSVVTTSPVTVSIATNDEFLDLGGDGGGFALVGIDADGLFYGDGCVAIIERRMVAELALGDAGTYTIAYQFVSADGHSLSEGYTIDFAPGPEHSPSAGRAETPVCGGKPVESNPGETTDVATPASDVAQEAQPLGLPLPTIAGIIALVVVAAGLALSGVRKRKNRS